MSKSILTNSQKRELIKKYQEEVVKLQYQLEKFEDIISELNKEKATKTDKKANTARRRGRPSKAKTEAVIIQAKRRGRPPKAKADTAASEPKRRGRPPKAKVDIVASEPKRRGRPPKAKIDIIVSEPKRRGRPPKAKTDTVASQAKRRGRPPKAKVDTVASQAKRRGRPRKTVSVPTVSLANELKNNTKLKNEPKKRQRIVENGYKLSDWDNFVIETLNKKQIVLITKDFIEASKLRSESEKSKFDEAKVKNMLNRSLHKLSNKRGDIIKTKYNGKGFAYALPKWVSNSSKKLKKKYQRK
ncbi:MAG: hypothetical protein P8P48_04435 [Saprospiraceae bacterium]|nr:hypothetical protein [Saprospiraceae bacterium]